MVQLALQHFIQQQLHHRLTLSLVWSHHLVYKNHGGILYGHRLVDFQLAPKSGLIELSYQTSRVSFTAPSKIRLNSLINIIGKRMQALKWMQIHPLERAKCPSTKLEITLFLLYRTTIQGKRCHPKPLEISI